MPNVIYGIKNCDTIKKALKWLDSNGVEFVFHDYRKDGLDNTLLESLESKLGWETMVNKRGTTWRNLPEETKEVMDKSLALKTMLDNPAIIKRPILDTGNRLKLGFSDTTYQQLFSA
ncbi:MAG: arsenate reductase [Cycloclasticus sp. symbiont of Poecilosclerida sp. M]|nr:MAG: arsenate reductase [Cycloclasticus sp. symbiont of Poecilosclerida sp. M]